MKRKIHGELWFLRAKCIYLSGHVEELETANVSNPYIHQVYFTRNRVIRLRRGGAEIFYDQRKVLSRTGLEPVLLGSKDRPSELPFILIVTLLTRFVFDKSKTTSGGRRASSPKVRRADDNPRQPYQDLTRDFSLSLTFWRQKPVSPARAHRGVVWVEKKNIGGLPASHYSIGQFLAHN